MNEPTDKLALSQDKVSKLASVSEWKLIAFALIISAWGVMIPVGLTWYNNNLALPEGCVKPPAHNPSKDPAPGIAVELAANDLLNRSVWEEGKRTVLIALSNCSECSLKAVPTAALGKTGMRIVLALSTVPPDLPKHLTNLGDSFRFIKLDDGLKSTLNADYLPRMYLIDNQGRLAAFQREPSDALEFAASLTKAK